MDDARLNYLSGTRTRFLATAGSDEQGAYSDPYGGFLVPIGFSPNLLTVPADMSDAGIVTTRVPMTTPTVTFSARVDKDHSTSVSGGLTVTRRAETQSGASSRMSFEQVTIKADPLYGLAYATEELLADSPQSFVAMLEQGFNDQFNWHLVGERIEGTGVGEYLGVRNCGAYQAIAKETGQAADTIVSTTWRRSARCWNYGRAVWHYNQDCLPTLMTMTIPVGTGGILAWQTSARDGEPDMFLGRPAYACEHCETVGDAGASCYASGRSTSKASIGAQHGREHPRSLHRESAHIPLHHEVRRCPVVADVHDAEKRHELPQPVQRPGGSPSSLTDSNLSYKERRMASSVSIDRLSCRASP